MIWVIDYESGNIRSLTQMLNYLGVNYHLGQEKPKNCRGIILPGVGHFGFCARALSQVISPAELINLIADQKIPTLGICVGFQLLFKKSEEAPDVDGLGLFGSTVSRLKIKCDRPQHHVGWNSVNAIGNDKISTFLKKDFYFVHSFAVLDHQLEGATTGISKLNDVNFLSFIKSKNIMGCQFHPERSGWAGLSLLQYFCELCNA